jgi:hypothetical protein
MRPARGGRLPDAGRGSTFFPYFLSEILEGAEITGCDYSGCIAPRIEELNRR